MDKSRFEVFAFSFGSSKEDALRQRVSKAVEHFIDVSGKSDPQIAQLARDMAVDIAIDLGGHTGDARTGVFALRAAPIQVNYLGFPGTMGASYIDYLLCDSVVCPPGSEAVYSEKIARLPHCFMPHDSTQVISDRVFTRAEFDLPDKGFVFCCFNNHYKINPDVFDIWMRLLQKLPSSVLWLSDASVSIQDKLRQEAAARGVASQRIVFARRLERMDEHLARYRLADLFIDTWPYNAHTTACDALWAGLPVLTCAGQTFASRVAASLLTSIGLPELITTSPSNYEATALDLATQPEKLKGIGHKLANNRSSAPLFDTRQLANDLGNLLTSLVPQG